MTSRSPLRLPFATLIVILGTLLLAGPASAESQGHFNFVLGQKMLDDDEWGNLDGQEALAIEWTWGREDWPFFIATDFLYSTTDEDVSGFNFEGTTWEIDLGVRKIWERGNARPYVGGGLAWVNGEADVGGLGSADGSGLGGWIGGGVFWRMGARFNIGFAVRLSRAEADIEGTDVEAGGDFVGLTLGWGWPGY